MMNAIQLFLTALMEKPSEKSSYEHSVLLTPLVSMPLVGAECAHPFPGPHQISAITSQ